MFLAWFGIKSYRVGTAVQSLLARQTQIETLLAGGLTQMSPDQAEEIVLGLRQDVQTLKRETAVFMPLTPYLRAVPRAGPLLAKAPELMEMADAGTETAVYLLVGLKPALTVLQTEDDSSQMVALVHVLNDAAPQLKQAGDSLARLAAARQALGDIALFPWRVRTLLEQADPLLPIAQDGLQAALVLPRVMGIDASGVAPRRYLIIAQNEDEVRPTGGFITGAGLLEVADGRIVSLSFQDANFVDNWQEKPYDFPPQPYYDFMGLELFLYRDSNFWPDFPTSAETALRLYSYGQDVPEPDGAIAIDQQFIAHLLQAIGPVIIAETGETITHKNVVSYFQTAWAKSDEQRTNEWINERKSFMSTFGEAVQSKIETGLDTLEPLTLIRTLHAAAAAKHVQVYMRDPEVAAVFDALNWDGRLENPPAQDVFAVIDTNMGYNKVNLFVERSFDYTVRLPGSGSLPDDGRAQANLTVHYTNNAPFEPDEIDCFQDTIEDYALGPTYLELADECYWNYVRVYVPDASELISSTTHTVPAETQYNGQGWHSAAQVISEFTGWQTFANYLLVPQQETVAASFTYFLPETAIKSENGERVYRLFLNQQAGAAANATSLKIHLPSSATLLQTLPEAANVNGNVVTIHLSLVQDTVITIRYQ